MENLDLDPKVEIFSRLPVESIFQCKLVCKTWLTQLENDPLFPQMHLRRRLLMLQQQQQFHDVQNEDVDFSQPQSSSGDFELGFMYLKYLEGSNRRSCQQWYGKYGKNDDNDDHSLRSGRRINHPNIMMGPFGWEHWNVFIGSCNGLICCNITHNGIEDPIYICNPITREFIFLPRFISSDEIYSSTSKNYFMVGGFGYYPSSNEYKVVRIFYPNYYLPQEPPHLGRIQVYTLGDGNGWRDKGEITTFKICYGQQGVSVNGEIHWLVNNYWLVNNWKIVAFNLALEEFHLIASPPIVVDLAVYDTCRLCVMGGWLCLSHFRDIGQVDIWLLKKKTSTTGYDDMNEQVEYQRGGWIKEFAITIDHPINPLGLTKRGEILFIKSSFHCCLCIYDLKTATLEELETLDCYLGYTSGIPHLNSFVSLKALEKKCRRRKKNYV